MHYSTRGGFESARDPLTLALAEMFACTEDDAVLASIDSGLERGVTRVRHDANNPITAALGHVQLLLEDPAVKDEEVRESLRIVESELRRLIDILRRLNEIRVDSG